YLDAPVIRLGGLDVPIPYNRTLEYHVVPQEETIIEAVRKVVRGKA
ncbi:MAG: alpha-ketoacid dehydrogenase subunit beta, partial [Anaerolineae bacterium]|nr:alpha-ketoacid dehydrogenase subunit beta [Anaerolineae bacterium]